MDWICGNQRFEICKKINSVNLIYLNINKMDRYFEEIDKNKYLTLAPANESKEKILKNH